MAWQTEGLCVGKGHLFYKSGARPSYVEAEALCAVCPVLAECRADLFHHEVSVWQVQGYRAGMTPPEREQRLRDLPNRRSPARVQRSRLALQYAELGNTLAQIARLLNTTDRNVSRMLADARAERAEETEAA